MSTDLAKKLALDNRLFVEQLDQTIENSGLPSSAIRDLIKKVNKKLKCDEECEKQKIIEQLKKKWEISKNIASSSESKELDAEKKYYTAFKGEDYYKNKILKKRHSSEIDSLINSIQQQLNKNVTENSAVISSYSAAYISLQRLKELELVKLEDYNKLEKMLNNLIKNSNTSERKVFYKFQDIDIQKKYYMYLLIAYYVIIVAYLIYYIVKGQNLKNKLFWTILIILSLVPYILKFLVKKIYDYFNNNI